jgi:hypothetical protein
VTLQAFAQIDAAMGGESYRVVDTHSHWWEW